MPTYGEQSYWDERYLADAAEPFDWLFTYEDVAHLMRQLVPKDATILMVGCGNAPFSKDMFNDGYEGIVNTDISKVVIQQQREACPEMRWEVMDVRNMDFPDGSFDLVIDKSLIDTVMCYQNSIQHIAQMITELRRVMKPGGRCISFSLHKPRDVVKHFAHGEYGWRVNNFRIPNPRWDEGENSKRSVAHTMIVCDLPSSATDSQHPLLLSGVLSEEEYNALEARARKINAEQDTLDADGVDLLLTLFDKALQEYQRKKQFRLMTGSSL